MNQYTIATTAIDVFIAASLDPFTQSRTYRFHRFLSDIEMVPDDVVWRAFIAKLQEYRQTICDYNEYVIVWVEMTDVFNEFIDSLPFGCDLGISQLENLARLPMCAEQRCAFERVLELARLNRDTKLITASATPSVLVPMVV